MAKQDPQFLTGQKGIDAYASQPIEIEERISSRGKAVAFQTLGDRGRTFVGHDTNISVRSDYNRADYNYFRPSQRTPQTDKEIISLGIEAYDKVGLVHNMIDLMSEFASYGIRLQHPRKTTENFYNKWFNDTVKGPGTSCKFVCLLLKAGNTIVKRNDAKMPVVDEREWKRAIANDLEIQKLKFEKREIPVRYTFINPLSVNVIGEELANFVGKPALELIVNSSLNSSLNRSFRTKKSDIQKLKNTIPKDILSKLERGDRTIPLDMDKVDIFHYKKDDWMMWAFPITYSVINDLIMLEKMKLADISALDGAISNIRLWKLGVLDGPNSILPNKSVINKLRNILANNVGGGVLDLVWGPELEFKESDSQVYKFLGSEKYDSALNAVYEGFGIPPSLRAGGSATNTGNFIGLNTLVKRLQYVRDILVSFWKKQIEIVHKAMNFNGPLPSIVFDNMVLADEAAEKQLLINLWDRDIISTESIREIFGRVPEVESSRVSTEVDNRGNKDMPEKAGPYHNPDKEHEYKKLLLQGGSVTPSEVGMELEPKKDGEKSKMDLTKEAQIEMKKLPQTNQTGIPGRPNNVVETQKRKQKPTEKPSTNALINVWANKIQEKIGELANPALLGVFGKNSMRELTRGEFVTSEHIKFFLLNSLEPFEEVDEKKIVEGLANLKVDNEMLEQCESFKKDLASILGREPKTDEVRQIYSNVYALWRQ